MLSRKSILFFALVLSVLWSCRKTPDFDQLSSNFVVITNQDSAANFSNYATYYISDTVANIGGEDKDTILTDNVAQSLVAQVKKNMDARGYTFVAKNANPDLGINMGVIKVTSTTVIFPGWWWGYPGWWDPWYWGGYYPYYYPWTVAYSVTTGTIVIDLIDLKNSGIHLREDVLWNAVMSGALGSNSSANLQNGLNAIDQAFIQTPDLHK